MFQLNINKKNTKEALKRTLSILKKGGLVVFPSDTVYGLLVDATSEKAVKKLIQFKNRPPGKAISVFVSDFEMLEGLVEIDKKQKRILKEILPGQFTVVLKSKHKTCQLLESERKTLGVRFVKFSLINQLIKNFGRPITATSANLAGRPIHYSVETFINELSEKKKKLIDLIVDAGQLSKNKPSTVIDLTQPEVKILRQGDVDFVDKRTFISKSPEQTKKIARKIFTMVGNGLNRSLQKSLVFIIEGELGVGKTIFVKGIGEELGIKNIISPTFVIYYEYEIEKSKVKNKKSKFIHLDLYNIEEKNEFEYLGINKLLKPSNILCFEWGEKAGEIYELLKSKAKIIYVKMRYVNEKEREIIVNF